MADKILEIGKIKISWMSCKIKERIEIQRCYRCLEYGPRVKECTGSDRENVCHKCGKEGHQIKDCQNEEHCWVCKKLGHKTGTIKCPDYKKRLKNKNKKSIKIKTKKKATEKAHT